jgi:hypothetical protein
LKTERRIKEASAKDVRNAYKFILGRLPENKDLINQRAKKVSQEELRRELLLSVEFVNLYSRKDFSVNIPQKTLKTALKKSLKPKLIWAKSFVKKHPFLLWLAKFLVRFFPEKIEKRLRGLQVPQTIPIPQLSSTISCLPSVDEIRVKQLYAELNAACERVKDGN